MQHDDVMICGKLHQPFVKGIVGHSSCGVARIAHIHQFDLIRIFNGIKIDQIPVLFFQGHKLHSCPGQTGGCPVNRIVGIRNQDCIPGVAIDQRDMRQCLLAAFQQENFIRLQVHPVPVLVPVLDSLDHLRKGAQGILPGGIFLHSLTQGFLHCIHGRDIG